MKHGPHFEKYLIRTLEKWMGGKKGGREEERKKRRARERKRKIIAKEKKIWISKDPNTGTNWKVLITELENLDSVGAISCL